MTSAPPGDLFGYRLRREQRRILGYRGGRMAVSAVPGSGKTLTLSLLAARLLVEGLVGAESEVLVVTVQNSAVVNIAQRIRGILESEHLPPAGFRVCTLHKLAADILRQRYDLAGVDDAFVIVDEAERGRLLSRAVETWCAAHRAWWASFLPPEQEVGRQREHHQQAWRQETIKVADEVTKLAKHLRLSPSRLLEMVGETDDIVRMGAELYALYAEYLQVRGGLDFDDLIWRALDALEQDATFLAGLQRRWPYILEDEAQDSSPLQEHILDRLSGPSGNWVRVGDPNQSINSTFTAADARFFRRFLGRQDITRVQLPQSGRCAAPIMDLANYLVRWTRECHPQEPIRQMAFEPQEMVCTEAGDPQPNPPPDECVIRFAPHAARDPAEEAERAVKAAAWFLAHYPEDTCAILCPNRPGIGVAVVAALDKAAVPYDDLLTSIPALRSVARLLSAAFDCLCQPAKRRPLETLFRLLAERGYLGGSVRWEQCLRRTQTVLRSVPPAQLLFPTDVIQAREAIPAHIPVEAADLDALERYVSMVAKWMRAAGLSPDQLLLTIAQDLFRDETDLALCHALAGNLRGLADTHPDWRLEHHRDELQAVARNRRSLGLSLADSGYVDQPGRVIVTTMHKAKGLEWDMVVLMGVTDLEFPSTGEDAFRDEPYFMPGRAPAIEARKRVEQLAGAEFACGPGADVITAARMEYIAERLRLLYVGITRAKRYLLFSHHQGTSRRGPLGPAQALVALQEYQQRRSTGS